MYFPYLRGKQQEQFAIRELTQVVRDVVVPVFEPTSVSSIYVKRYADIAAQGVRFALITNSRDGSPAPSAKAVQQVIDKDLASHVTKVFPAFELRGDSSLSDLGSFTSKYRDRVCLIVHRKHAFPQSQIQAGIACRTPPIHVFLSGAVPASLQTSLPASARVLVRDGFDRHVPNGSYPRSTGFDDLAYAYQSLGMDGFGDFSVIGDQYSSGGGAAKHIALHLTESVSHGNIITNHFISKTPPTTGNLAAKYFDALSELVNYVGNPPSSPFDTLGVHDYLQSASPAHFPGLAMLKRWSIKHHTELVSRILALSGAKPVI